MMLVEITVLMTLFWLAIIAVMLEPAYAKIRTRRGK